MVINMDIIKLKFQKKGMELALSTIVKLILAMIVLVLVILFFTTEFGSNFTTILNIGDSGIEGAKNFEP